VATVCGSFELVIEELDVECTTRDLGRITAPVERVGEDPCAEGSSLYDPGPNGCTGNFQAGRELLYELVLPPGTNVTFSVDPTGSRDLALYTITTCLDFSALSCEATLIADSGGPGAAESFELSNPSGRDAAIIVVVDTFGTFGPDTCTAFDLSITGN
jgi:hypothetical protein